jgi:hypothetical protein
LQAATNKEVSMQRKVVKLLATLAMTAAVIVGSAVSSEAAFIAYICNDQACAGGDDFAVADGNGDGVIVNFGSYFGFTLTLNASASKPALDNGMDLDYDVIAGSGSGTIYFFASDTDFAGPATLSATYGGTNDDGGTSQAIICGGNDNTSSPADTLSGPCVLSASQGTGAFGTSFGPLSATANPYAVTIGVGVTIQAGDAASGDLRLNSAPEPTSMGLFGLALFGLAGAVRKRFAN